ncbi:hypothetical protein CAPTEDRAFT_213136 [Capitella teleta]|uniref:Receptor ligand binding region domain-containing protein n=1 Tax=Capitella teleta TaxID=283909 RepID=R7TDS0_CAPTE|nr:hypothetical protein CAPTEDRAFT_213136 [Capitella teleta]|eukprot:ELT89211.1 hypothetical protein CAPTEDRAFT_213136 [Capitella teleta]
MCIAGSFSVAFLLLFVGLVHSKIYKLGLLTPLYDDLEFAGKTSAAAVDMAIERINSDSFYNRNGEIKMTFVIRDTKCNSKQAIGQAADLWYNESVDAVIGPPCSIACRGVAEITSFFKIPHISWVASDPDLDDKVMYSTLSRTLGPFSKMGEFIVDVMAQYNWKRVVTLSSNYLQYMDASKAIRKVFNDNNISIAYQSTYDRTPAEKYITQTLLKTKTEGRIVFLFSPFEDRRRFMLKAHDLGMTKGDYVFYTIDMLPDEQQFDPDSIWRGNDGRDAEAREAFKSVFHVSLAALTGKQISGFRQEVGRRMRSPPYSFSLTENVKNGYPGEKWFYRLIDRVTNIRLFSMTLS